MMDPAYNCLLAYDPPHSLKTKRQVDRTADAHMLVNVFSKLAGYNFYKIDYASRPVTLGNGSTGLQLVIGKNTLRNPNEKDRLLLQDLWQYLLRPQWYTQWKGEKTYNRKTKIRHLRDRYAYFLRDRQFLTVRGDKNRKIYNIFYEPLWVLDGRSAYKEPHNGMGPAKVILEANPNVLSGENWDICPYLRAKMKSGILK